MRRCGFLAARMSLAATSVDGHAQANGVLLASRVLVLAALVFSLGMSLAATSVGYKKLADRRRLRCKCAMLATIDGETDLGEAGIAPEHDPQGSAEGRHAVSATGFCPSAAGRPPMIFCYRPRYRPPGR